ncbi:MAG: chorismate synthase, partial [Bacteroidaceae bacterium]|nr:chorismate synthase [Bacteroidaceae bacterium]
MNSFGHIFRITTFGESHGPAVGGVIDGMPAGIDIDTDLLNADLARRRPGQSLLTTPRNERDKVEILSGVFEGKSTGCPIGFIVRNQNQHSSDYDNLRNLFRPSHADYTYHAKYGIRDHSGGGRSSARETTSRVVGGAFAKMLLRQLGVSITAWVRQVGPLVLDRPYSEIDFSLIESNPVRCPDPELAQQMADLIWEVKGKGDTIGGVVECVVQGVPAGWGEPAFDKLHATLG